MTEREAALNRIAVGNIFHAGIQLGEGPSYVCLTLQVRESKIFARRMTTQSVHWFDRASGVEIDDERVVVNSVATLPEDIHQIMLGLDRKYREDELRYAEDPDWVMPDEETKLTAEQKRALLFIGKFYRDHPLPPRQ